MNVVFQKVIYSPTNKKYRVVQKITRGWFKKIERLEAIDHSLFSTVWTGPFGERYPTPIEFEQFRDALFALKEYQREQNPQQVYVEYSP